MNIINRYIAVAAMGCAATGASAQALNSGYFLDGYLYNHQLNPALMSEKSYVSIPALGNINITSKGNVGLGSFLFPIEGDRLTTFMSSSVDAKEFLGGLKNMNKMSADVSLSVFSMGLKKWGGFNTLDIGLRSTTSLFIPKDMFEFMKVGQQGSASTYDIGNLGVSSSNYVEVALGHSRQWNDKLRVGAKLKFLLGAGYANFELNDANVTLSEDKWEINANGEMNAALAGLIIPTKGESGKELKNPGEETLVDFDNIDYDSPGLSGFGLAIDLGATYKVMDNLTVSAALKDLGFISWSNNTHATTENETWTFDGFHDLSINGESGNTLDDQLDRITDDFEDYANLHRRSVGGRLGRALAATLNIGAEYSLPMYDKLSFGFLSSTRINGAYSWSEGRFSANVSPLSWFEAGVNYNISSFGSTMGAILNFHPKGFSFFVGMDYLIGKVNTQFIPINNMNASASLGFNVTF